MTTLMESDGFTVGKEVIYGEGVYYTPFIAPDGRVGYSVCEIDGSNGSREVFIYLNPSASCEGGTPPNDVFLYMGIENDPAEDEPMHFYGIDGPVLT